MKTLDKDISNLIKHSKNLNHRAVVLLTGENRLKRLGVVCNFIEKLGTKNILYCYVKDNKKRKLDVKGKKRKSTCQNVQMYLQKQCSSEIRWCLYKETQNILGKTFDICIFQDYELLTPNIIARGMETVSGGGLIIFLAPPLGDLELYFNNAYNASINRICNAQRFLKRFTVSLLSSKFCICIDDQFNLLNKKKKPIKFTENPTKKINRDLTCLKESLKLADSAFYPIVNICATYDQARCLKTLCSSIKMFHDPSNKDDNDVRHSVTAIVTAARGRGKSAALGLALCAALETGLTQICVTSPSPENISTVWEYVKLGLKALDYSEHIDYEITTSYMQDGVKSITKVELKKSKFTQVIRYIVPSDTESLDCDLLCIDEAAAIPLHILQMYLRSFNGLVFVSSTISGYEGSGMSLSTQLFEELRQTNIIVNGDAETADLSNCNQGKLYEITLNEPIRYGNDDPVESFLFKSLCMNYKNSVSIDHEQIITPDACQLVVVDRDMLFDCNRSSEKLLQSIMSIYTASNHQNSPDDLKSLADNECSRLLCLTDSVVSAEDPTVLVVILISYEGEVNRDYIAESVRTTGVCPSIDLLSNQIVDEFLESQFKQLSGIRIEMIATNPQYANRGFGVRALKLLMEYISSVDHDDPMENIDAKSMLKPLHYLPNVSVNYVGIYTSLSPRLIRFFRKAGEFEVVYLDTELNEITGDIKGILLKRVSPEIVPDCVYNYNWMVLFSKIFRKKFSLLKHGYLRSLNQDFKDLLENSPLPGRPEDIRGLPTDSIRSFSVV